MATSRGGNDTLIGGDGPMNALTGDAFEMHDNARGGNDVLIGGGAGSINYLFGDAGTMDGTAEAAMTR